MVIAVPFGLIMAIYLSEYAKPPCAKRSNPRSKCSKRCRRWFTVFSRIAGHDAVPATFVPGLKGINLLVPGIILGIMILPYVVSVSEDAMRAVPNSLREGGYALGMAKWQVATRVS